MEGLAFTRLCVYGANIKLETPDQCAASQKILRVDHLCERIILKQVKPREFNAK